MYNAQRLHSMHTVGACSACYDKLINDCAHMKKVLCSRNHMEHEGRL